jgi:hypothetical protein
MEDATLINLWTRAQGAIDAAAQRMRDAESAESQRAADKLQAKADTAITTFQEGLKRFHTNKGKFTGDARTPRKPGAVASPALHNPFAGTALIQSQETNTLLRAAVEVGRAVSIGYAPRFCCAC